jgi:tRNA splicing endonuclease
VHFNAHSVQYWRVYARGVGREQERAQILLRLVDSKWGVSIKSLNMQIAIARQLRMELVLAFVDENKTPAFVKVNKFNLD